MAAHSEPLAPKKRLDSWKEIAAFFGRDERTVKRWEKERGLPVYRVPGSARGGVFAYAEELAEWLKAPNPTWESGETAAPEGIPATESGDRVIPANIPANVPAVNVPAKVLTIKPASEAAAAPPALHLVPAP